MKKFFAIAAFAVASLTVNAQTWIGGAFGFNWDKSKNENSKATTSWEIAPEIGHDIDETWAIAIKLGINSVKAGDADAVTGVTLTSTSAISKIYFAKSNQEQLSELVI